MDIGNFPVNIAREGGEGQEEKMMWKKNKSPTTTVSVWIPNVSFMANKEMLPRTTKVALK